MSQKRHKNEVTKKPETNITVDVSQKRSNAQECREEKILFALQNNRFPLRNETEKMAETNTTVDVSQKRAKNDDKKRLETNITVDVSQIRDDARDRREERVHFAIQNKRFAFPNEAK